MTQLQHLAFNRIEQLSKEIRNMLPKNYDQHIHTIEFPIDFLKTFNNKLWEQQAWIDALNDEEEEQR